MPVEKTETKLRFRQKDPKKYKRFTVKKIAPGIDFVLGWDESGKSETQSVVFDKKKFTMAQAKKWLKDKDLKMGEGATGTGLAGIAGLSGFVLDERLVLNEASLYDMEDADILALRQTMVDKRSVLRQQQMDMDDSDKYSSLAGRELSDDIYYYGRLIDQIESVMISRCLPLDSAGTKK